jgi:penicillin-binding protein 2
MGIGQGEVLATPIQVLNLINYIANKGYAYTPHLIKDKKEVDIKEINLDPKIWTFLDNAIYNAVKQGTGKNADIKNKDAIVRGKTGTAQNPHGEDHSWFAGYVTSKKTLEKMSIVVLVEHGGSGAGIASKVGHDFFKYFIENQE